MNITVQGTYPDNQGEPGYRTWSVSSDQSTDAAYQSGDLLCSESKTVSFGQPSTLTFYHQTAKVVVNVRQEGLPESIGATPDDIRLTIGEEDILTMDGTFTRPTSGGAAGWLCDWTPGNSKGSIKPHRAATPTDGYFATYEALVIPQDVTAGTRLLTFTAEKNGTSHGPFHYLLQNDVQWQGGYVYTYNITISYSNLDASVGESIDWATGNTGTGSVTLPN